MHPFSCIFSCSLKALVKYLLEYLIRIIRKNESTVSVTLLLGGYIESYLNEKEQSDADDLTLL